MTVTKTQKNIVMKDSGVEWIGEIPSEWELIRNRFLFTYRKGSTLKKINLGVFEGLPYLTAEVMRGKRNNIEYGLGDTVVNNNDILLLWDGANAGEYFFTEMSGIASSTFVHILPTNLLDNKYYFWIAKSFEKLLRDYTQGMGIPHVSQWILKDNFFPTSPKETQQRIVDYLDEKTGKVDVLIEKKKKMVELLKEKRLSVITHAVTCGLDKNGRLRQKPKKMPASGWKNSGVEWIGAIPEEWEVRKLKFLSKTFASNVDKLLKIDEEEVALCNYVDVYKNEEIKQGIDFMRSTANINQIVKYGIKQGDVLLTKDSETADDIGVSAYVEDSFENVVCGYHLYISRPKNIYGRYLFRFLQSQNIRQYFEISSNGVTRFGLSMYPLLNANILLPTEEVQQKIVEFLDKKTSKIDDIISKIEKQIKLLAEYRASLIYHAVTGKIKI